MATYFQAARLDSRNKLCDFILSERTSPGGWSRKQVPFVKGVKIGDLLKLDGSKATAAADIAGIALIDAPSVIDAKGNAIGDGFAETGYESLQIMLCRDAEIRDLNWSGVSGNVITALAALRIDVISTGL